MGFRFRAAPRDGADPGTWSEWETRTFCGRGGGAGASPAMQVGASYALRRDLLLVRVIQEAQRAFCVTDARQADNPIVWVSDAFLRMTGYSRAAARAASRWPRLSPRRRRGETVGRNCRFLQGPRTDPRQVSVIRDAVYKEHEASVTILNYRKDGTTFWNRFFVAPLRDAEGKVTFFVGVQTDVSAAFARPGTSDVDTPKPSPATLPRSLGSGA